jgi:hypothetical protein
MLHVLVSQNRYFADLGRSASKNVAVDWIVPKIAAVGDDAVIFVPDRGFVARGTVASSPERTTFGRGPAYRAEVGGLRLFRRPVQLERVIAAVPEWKWPTYPRTRASVPSGSKTRLMRLFHSVESQLVPGRDPMTDVPPAIEGIARETRILVRGRSDRLRRAALERSRGVCTVCATDFSKLLNGRGIRILHVHHRAQLSLGIRPRVTRIGDLAVVCPNCHGMLHLDPNKTLAIRALRKMLRIIVPSSAFNK